MRYFNLVFNPFVDPPESGVDDTDFRVHVLETWQDLDNRVDTCNAAAVAFLQGPDNLRTRSDELLAGIRTESELRTRYLALLHPVEDTYRRLIQQLQRSASGSLEYLFDLQEFAQRRAHVAEQMRIFGDELIRGLTDFATFVNTCTSVTISTTTLPGDLLNWAVHLTAEQENWLESIDYSADRAPFVENLNHISAAVVTCQSALTALRTAQHSDDFETARTNLTGLHRDTFGQSVNHMLTFCGTVSTVMKQWVDALENDKKIITTLLEQVGRTLEGDDPEGKLGQAAANAAWSKEMKAMFKELSDLLTDSEGSYEEDSEHSG